MKLQSEFWREFLKTIFARLPPLASAARCGPHPLATPLCFRQLVKTEESMSSLSSDADDSSDLPDAVSSLASIDALALTTPSTQSWKSAEETASRSCSNAARAASREDADTPPAPGSAPEGKGGPENIYLALSRPAVAQVSAIRNDENKRKENSEQNWK